MDDEIDQLLKSLSLHRMREVFDREISTRDRHAGFVPRLHRRAAPRAVRLAATAQLRVPGEGLADP